MNTPIPQIPKFSQIVSFQIKLEDPSSNFILK